MSNQVIPAKVIVAATLNELKQIMVPVDLLDQWGGNLSRAFNNLRMLYNAMNEADAKNHDEKLNEEAATEESPELKIVEGGNENAEKDQLEGTVQE